MSKREFAEVIVMLAAAYPRFKLEKETTEVYSKLLADIPIEDLKAAALHCATSRDFFPSVHELRQAVAEIKRKATGIPSAYEAWQDLKRAGRGVSKMAVEDGGQFYIEETHYQFIHPLVRDVAEMLGWPHEFPGDNPVADRAHFFKAYEQSLADLMTDATMSPLVKGYIEQQRNARLTEGERDGPKQISDYARAG